MSYRGGPTNSESYFSFNCANLSFIAATLLPRSVRGFASSTCSVRIRANSSKDRSKPPGTKAVSNFLRSVPVTLKAWTVPHGTKIKVPGNAVAWRSPTRKRNSHSRT